VLAMRQGLAREYSWAVGFLGLGLLICRLVIGAKEISGLLRGPLLVFLLFFILLEVSHLPIRAGLTVSLSFSAVLAGYLMYGELGACIVSAGALASSMLQRKTPRIALFNSGVLVMSSLVASKAVEAAGYSSLSHQWDAGLPPPFIPFVVSFTAVNGILVFYYGYLNSPESKIGDLGYNTGFFVLHMVVGSFLALIMLVIHYRWGPSNFYLSAATIAATVHLVSMAGRYALNREGLVNLYRVASSINEALTLRDVFEKAYTSAKSILDIDFAWLAIPQEKHEQGIRDGQRDFIIEYTWTKPGIDAGRALAQVISLEGKRQVSRQKERVYWNRDKDKLSVGYFEKVLVMPLCQQGQCLAEFGIASMSSQDVPQETLSMFAALSSHMTLAVDNALKFEKASHLASTDPITGLCNYREFHTAFSKILAKSRKSGSPVSLVYIDLDYFRDINNKYGHQVGDRVLYQIAQVFRQSCRDSDVVARLGGDEFAVILPGIGRAMARQIGARIKGRLREAVFDSGSAEPLTGVVSASVGVAVFPDDGEDSETLVNRADMDMYAGKMLLGEAAEKGVES